MPHKISRTIRVLAPDSDTVICHLKRIRAAGLVRSGRAMEVPGHDAIRLRPVRVPPHTAADLNMPEAEMGPGYQVWIREYGLFADAARSKGKIGE